MRAWVAYNKFKNKVHIIKDLQVGSLCGKKPYLLSVSANVDLDVFIYQPDYDESVCKGCKKSAIKILKRGN